MIQIMIPNNLSRLAANRVGEHNARPVHEVGEPGMARTHQAPHDAEQHQRAHDIACPHMDGQQIVLREVGNQKSNDDGPMRHPYERVPHL